MFCIVDSNKGLYDKLYCYVEFVYYFNESKCLIRFMSSKFNTSSRLPNFSAY